MAEAESRHGLVRSSNVRIGARYRPVREVSCAATAVLYFLRSLCVRRGSTVHSAECDSCRLSTVPSASASLPLLSPKKSLPRLRTRTQRQLATHHRCRVRRYFPDSQWSRRQIQRAPRDAPPSEILLRAEHNSRCRLASLTPPPRAPRTRPQPHDGHTRTEFGRIKYILSFYVHAPPHPLALSPRPRPTCPSHPSPHRPKGLTDDPAVAASNVRALCEIENAADAL